MLWSFGHVNKMEAGRIPRVMVELRENGKRRREGPRRRWVDDVVDVEKGGLSWDEAVREQMWNDHCKWVSQCLDPQLCGAGAAM